MNQTIEGADSAKRGPGRPTNAERAARMAEREPEHMATTGPDDRQAEHDPDHVNPRLRTRTRMRTSDADNPYWLPMDEIPEGLTYEWKRHANVGQENPFYIAQMRQQGWEPVQPRMHPNWLPPGYSLPHIIKEGLILMERPRELTEDAQAEQRQLAKQQIREAESRLGMAPKINGVDTGTRQLPQVAPRLTKEYVRAIQIED